MQFSVIEIVPFDVSWFEFLEFPVSITSDIIKDISEFRPSILKGLPPKIVKTVRELVYWEYAKLIAGSAVGDRKNYGFVTDAYKKLREGKLHPSTILRENQKLVKECADCCAYCNCKEKLQWEHIIPKSRGGPDNIDNMVLSCQKCNGSKSDKDPYEWYGAARKYEIPRIVLGKYLKLIYEAHEKSGTLDSLDLNVDGKLDVFDLGTIFRLQ
ncbi:MAG: hypothetical protein HMLIMOIP_000243 [Candidatus Nitrosomirales archaeon]|jgi:hypothetical protein